MKRGADEVAILRGIERIARDHLDHQGRIRGNENLVDLLELDSLRKLMLVVEVENLFRICLDDGTEDEIVTTRDLVGVIRSKLAEKDTHADRAD